MGVLLAGLAVLAAGWYRLAPEAGARLPDRYVEGVVGVAARPTPLFAEANAVDADLAALIFSGLTRTGPDGTPLPDLAERWDVSPDGLSYTFHLRSNLYWHDGESLTADDVAFTIGAIQDPAFAGPSTLALRWAGVTVQATDARTVVFHLPVSSASFLTLTALGIVPRHLLVSSAANLADAPFNHMPVGSGPYRLVALGDRGAVLEANPTYHFGLPAISHFEFRFYRDASALDEGLNAGEVDGALLGDTPVPREEDIVRARALRELPLVTGGYTALYFNNQHGPMDDPALRRALTAAIDRSALVRSVLGSRGTPGDGPIVPGTWAYAAGAWPAHNEAEAMFGLAGWRRDAGVGGLRRNGERVLRLELLTNSDPVREGLANAISDQLRDQGVEVHVTAIPASALVGDRLARRDYDMVLFGWESGADPDPYAGWHASQAAPPGLNIAGFRDAISDGLLEAARRTLDTGERRELYARFQARFVQQAPSVVLLYPQRSYALPSGLVGPVQGVLFDPSDRFRDVQAWRFVASASTTASAGQ